MIFFSKVKKMRTQNYIEKMKNIQANLLTFIDNEDNVEENHQNLLKLFDDYKIRGDRYDLKSILHLLSKIVDNHYRCPNFFDKIFKILLNFKDQIKNYYTNSDIFDIFSNNKRIILFLIEEKMLTIDDQIANILTSKEYNNEFYQQYLYNELKPFLSEKVSQNISKLIPEDFEEKRKIGENDKYICELIRKDNIDKCITFSNKNSLYLNSKIESSLFETNSYLLENKATLIEYAAFFGSIQIFRYLNLNGVKLTHSLWTYAIHGRNPEMINYLEEKKVHPKESDYDICINEAIKCHHNEIVNYIHSNILNINYPSLSNELLSSAIECYNYNFFQNNFSDESSLIKLCQNDYFNLLINAITDTNFNVNKRIILFYFFLNPVLNLVFFFL